MLQSSVKEQKKPLFKRGNPNKHLKFIRLYDFALRVVGWFGKVFGPSVGNPKGFEPLISDLSKVFRTRGPREGIKYSKALRLSVIYWLTNDTRKVEGVAYGSNGTPKVLQNYLTENMRRSPRKLAVLLTVLCVSRAVHLPEEPDFSTIEAASKQRVGYSIGEYVKDFWRDLGYHKYHQVPKRVRWSKFHFTTKSGPNGQGLWTSLSDLRALHENEELLESIKFVGGEKFCGIISNLLRIVWFLPSFGKKKPYKLRKLVAFPDKEGKTRIVAILDYWSQTVLRPVHYLLFQVLKRIPQDKTFAQGAFKDNLKDSDIYYSVDLTAATDRFPMSLIEEVLKGLLPDDFIRHWSNIMIKFPFDYNGTVKKYLVGNPMGAYSSWSSFAVAHHYVVYYCCKRTGTDWKSLKYSLLGDDIVIANKEVAEMYLRVIRDLGVDVSPSKTHVSTTTYEFAKRWIHKGDEITPFPLSSLKENDRRYYTFVNLLIEVREKGWLLSCSIPEAIDTYYTFVKKFPSRMRKKLSLKVIVSEVMMYIMNGTLSANEGLNSLIRQFGYRIPELTLEECENVLSNIAVEMFADSNPQNVPISERSRQKPLGLLAENFLLYITSEEFEKVSNAMFVDPCIVPESIPLLAIYGQIEENYLELCKRVRRVDTIHAGEWPSLLRSMLLPVSDEVFYTRPNDMKPFASSLFGNHLHQRFEVLQSPMGRRLLGR
jgi:hypothetical protein